MKLNVLKRNGCIGFVVAAALSASVAVAAEHEGKKELSAWKVKPLAQDFVKIYESPSPKDVYCYSPGLARCPNGRLVATMDIGGRGVSKLPGLKRGKTLWRGKVFTSDDHGKTWTHRTNFPFCHARPFVAGDSLYVLGQGGDLKVMRSDDWGQTWSEPAMLTKGQKWHQAPCNVCHANGCVYLVMERRAANKIRNWPVGDLAPVLLRGKIGDDLTKRENWTFASELVFRETLSDDDVDYFGVPFFKVDPIKGGKPGGRGCAPMGWLETNVVQFVDPDHYWYDPKGKTFHLWMRAHTGGTGYAAIAKVVEGDDGSMTTMLATVPSGKKALWLPCPGGQMKFHIVYDEKTKLYWLLSSQATDSMTRADKLPSNRYNLPNNERHRLQLHFSKNCVDWCFAGLVAVGGSAGEGRHYASMIIDGDDLHILSRSGDARAKNAHDGNFISFHTVKGFRELVY
ncbi:MAG: sialidase family protein [Planctomycetota bacterium]|nr:sialidase family protein [Planctomycetota bacterium]